jgi:hypothetical protein
VIHAGVTNAAFHALGLLLVVNNDIREFFPFREGSSNGDSATFAIGGEDHANSVNDLSAFLNC